jgi:hypothetical protein
LPAGAAFLAKPYGPMELARKVRAVLDAAISPLVPDEEERDRR